MTTPITTQRLDDAIRAGLRGGPPDFIIPQQETASKDAGYRDNLAHYRQVALKRLDEGDYRQAVEKSWGAYSQAIKVVAAGRGMNVSTHRNLLRVAEELRKLVAATDPDAANRLHIGYLAARGMHHQFYEGDSPDSEVTRSVTLVMDAVDLLLMLFQGV